MRVSENERSIRRRLLSSAMPSDTAPNVLQAAIELLENEFGDEPTLRYSELVKRLREQLDQRAELDGLLTKIMVLRNKPDALGPDPLPGSSPQPGQPSARQAGANVTKSHVATPLQPKFTVFNFLFAQIVEKLALRGEHLVGELTATLGESGLSALKGFREWSSTVGQHSPRIVGTDEELHKMINATFVWMCNKFGPVVADRILGDAVRQTEQLPEAFENSPRAFL